LHAKKSGRRIFFAKIRRLKIERKFCLLKKICVISENAASFLGWRVGLCAILRQKMLQKFAGRL
jgi:hypothetical protein